MSMYAETLVHIQTKLGDENVFVCPLKDVPDKVCELLEMGFVNVYISNNVSNIHHLNDDGTGAGISLLISRDVAGSINKPYIRFGFDFSAGSMELAKMVIDMLCDNPAFDKLRKVGI